MEPMKRIAKNLYRESSLTFLTSLMSSIYIIVDQLFAARISPNYLYADSVMSYIPIFYLVSSRVLGSSLNILRNKEPLNAKWLTGGAILLQMVFGLAGLLVLFFSRKLFFDYFSLSDMPGCTWFFFIHGITGFGIGINLLFKFILLSASQQKVALRIDAIGNMINLVGNFIAIFLLKNDGNKFVALGVTTLVVQVCVIGFQWYKIKELSLASLRINHLNPFLQRAKGLIMSQSSTSALVSILPFFIAVFLKPYGQNTLSAFNIGQNLSHILERPIISLCIAATTLMARSNKNEAPYYHRIVSISSYSYTLLFVFVLVAFLKPLLSWLYKIQDQNAILVVGVILLSLVPAFISSSTRIALTIMEENRKITTVQFLGFISTLVIFFFLHQKINAPLLFGIGLLAIEAFKGISYWKIHSKTQINLLSNISPSHSS